MMVEVLIDDVPTIVPSQLSGERMLREHRVPEGRVLARLGGPDGPIDVAKLVLFFPQAGEAFKTV